MENTIEVPQKTKRELPHTPAIPLLGVYWEKILIWKDTCTTMFIAAVISGATETTWKQSKSPLTDEWIKMWYIYTMAYYSAIKKEWNDAIFSNMSGPRDYDNKWSEIEKDKYHMISLICGTWKKRYKRTYMQNRNRLCYCSSTKLGLTLCDPTDCSTPGSSVHCLPEFTLFVEIDSQM